MSAAKWGGRGERVCTSGLGAAGGLLMAVLSASALAAPPDLRRYETPYYILYTDLDEHGVREATLRITLMAEEYVQRTKGFAGTVHERLPFYLLKDMQGYLNCGGEPGTAGVYMGSRLMAVVHPERPQLTWSTVQHEGFHQFVDAAIGRSLPIWVNEGMAEYFGEGIFTGDRFYVGLIPPERLARVRQGIRRNRFLSLHEMMSLSLEEWNTFLRAENYDQAWSMVQFLAHGDGGRYEQATMGFLRAVAKRTPWERAWVANFGADVGALQKRWEEYWLGLPENPTADLYAEVVLSTLTSFYARAVAQRQRFETAEEFFAAARGKQLRMSTRDWLPSWLLEDALRQAPEMGTWSLEPKGTQRLLTCQLPDGSRLQGRFDIRGGKVMDVRVERLKKRR